MKKLLGILLVCALVVPASAANIFSNVETYGEVQTIGAKASNIGVPSDVGVNNRVIFGLGMDLVEDVRANVSFINTNSWGDTTTNGQLGQGQNINGFLDEINVVEANVAISNIFGAWDLKVGRQFYGNEDSKIIYFGPTHGRYNLVRDSLSLDAAVLAYNSEKIAFNAIYGKLARRNLPAVTDNSLAGLDFTYMFNENLNAQAYWYDIEQKNDPSDHLGIFGIKPTFAADNLIVSAEFAKNYEGKVFQDANKGWMAAVDASLKMGNEDIDLTPRAGYYRTEKDFVSFGNYAPGLLFGGIMLGPLDNGANYGIFNVGLDFAFPALDKFTFAFDWYAINSGPRDHSAWFGNEFDLTAKYTFNEYVDFNGGIAYITNSDATDDPYAFQLGMLVKF